MPNYTDKKQDIDVSGDIFFGKNSVLELLKSDTGIEKLYIQKGMGGFGPLLAKAAEKMIPFVETDKRKLDMMSGGNNHQGVIATVSKIEYAELDDIITCAAQKKQKPLVVICDSVTDPHNLGAIIRSALCAGAHGVIIGKRRSATINETVAKPSAGAVFHIPIVKAANINSAIEYLKENNIWVWALDSKGTDIYKHDFTGGCAFILGSEGAGISRLTGEIADFTASIPVFGSINSLNVSNAAAVALYEAVRQRENKTES